VSLVLQPVDLDPVRLEPRSIHLRQRGDRLLGLLHGALQDTNLSLHRRKRRLDRVQHEDVAGCLYGVEHVVHRSSESVDVLAIYRSDEHRVEAADDLVSDVVAFVFALGDASSLDLDVPIILDQIDEEVGGAAEVRRGFGEQLEELLGPLRDPEFHRYPSVWSWRLCAATTSIVRAADQNSASTP